MEQNFESEARGHNVIQRAKNVRIAVLELSVIRKNKINE